MSVSSLFERARMSGLDRSAGAARTHGGSPMNISRAGWARPLGRIAMAGAVLAAALGALVAGGASPAGAVPSLKFPWDRSENPWTLTQGPHNWSSGSQSGLDFDKDSTPRRVLSMFEGDVTFVGNDAPFTCSLNGQRTQNPTVKVRASDGTEIWYLHLSQFSVSTGTHVRQGALLGYSGRGGCSTAVHLHVELVINGAHASWWGRSIDGWQVSAQRQQLSSTNTTSTGTTSPPTSPPPAGCSPNADQVALYDGTNFGGTCVVKGIGTYPNPASFSPLGNDQAESVWVGANVKTTICQNDDMNSFCEELSADDSDLGNNSIGRNQVSSFRVESRTAPPPQPNLRPTSITFDPSSAVVGRAVYFDSGVENAGGANSGGFNIKWRVDGQEVGAYGGHSGVGAGQTVLAGNSQFSWSFSTAGSHTVTFIVDVDNHVQESNEQDNATTVVVQVT